MFRKLTVWLIALVMVMGCCSFAGADSGYSGVVYDEDGGVWNFDKGTYTTPEGQVVQIERDDGTPSSGSSAGMTVTDSSGVEIPKNADGSITVQSGQIQLEEPGTSSGGHLTQEEWAARMQKAINRNGDYTQTWYFGAEKDPVPVDVKYMGLARSMITYQGTSFLVNTCDLAWATEAPEDQVLAVVDASRVGYAALRANTSTKSFIMDHCITGSVVRVLATGKNWTKIDYRGMRGYVLTSSLEFHANVLQGYETGLIAIDGRTTGRSTINIRANAKNNSRILADYVLGTPLTIFSRDEKWCEVDVEGWHCYILSEYVSLESGSRTAQQTGSR